jgi:uncharacterized RDD family membrane protein YckC
MQMTTEARAWLDATVRRILARHNVGDAERAGLTYELMSHLHAAGESRATAAGRSEVARENLEAALAKAGGDEGLGAAFVEPLAKPVERATVGPRAVAFGIDAFLIAIALTFVHSAMTSVFLPVFGGPHAAHQVGEFQWLLPWAYHDLSFPLALQALIGVASAMVVMGYFTWFEANEGRSLGKRAMGLRVMRVDGRPMGPREAFLRNFVKLAPLVLILDTLIMMLAFPKERQRVSDRIAETIVVRA